MLIAIALSPMGHCLAQTISGTVRGKGEARLVGANVVASKEAGKTVAYSITDGEGRFSLDIPKGETPTQVTVSYMGYQSKTLPFSQLRDGMAITLTEGTFKIREVRVRSQRIKATGDTLTYSVAGFRQQQDRSIADVLAKMPGIEVKPDGRVEYQGKAINKFYIEGLDLMGSQYGVANKNLSADKVKSVQVMRNHQPVRSLRGVSFSDQAALNIVLRDDAKAVWNGSADIGLGYGDELLHDSRLMAMRFNKRFQTLMMYKDNNTGRDIGTEVADLARLGNRSADEERGIIAMPSVGVPDLGSGRYTFNESHLVAGNWLWRTGKNAELRLQGNGFVDRADMSSQSRTTYLTLDGLPVVTEERALDNTRSEWKGEANYQYNGPKTYIRSNLRGYVDFNKSVGRATVDGIRTDMMTKPRRRSLTGELRLSHTTEGKNVYEVNSTLSYSHLPGQLLTLNSLTERLDLHLLSTQNSLRYRLRLGRHYLNTQAGLDYHHQDIGVSLPGTAYQRHAYQLLQPYWQPSLSLLLANHKLDAAVKLSYARQEYRQSRADEVWVEPTLGWNWQLSPRSELSASLSHTARPMTGRAVYDVPVFTSYQTQVANPGEVRTQQAWSASMAYKFSDPIRGLFLNVRPLFSSMTGNVLYATTLDDGIYTQRATDKRYTTVTKGATARVSKAFSWARSVAGLSAGHTVSDYALLVGGSVEDARMSSTTVSLDYSLRPARKVSVEGESSLLATRQRNLSRPEASAGSTAHWQHRLELFLFPADAWMVTLKQELFHSSEPSIGANYFCDAAVSYKARRWELELTIGNFIGNSRYETRTLGNTIETYSVTRLRPREFLLKWSFDM